MFILTYPTRFYFHFSSPSISCVFSVHCSGIFLLCFEFLRFSIQLYFTLGPSFTLRASFKRHNFPFKLHSRYPWFQAFNCSFLLHFVCFPWLWYFIDFLFVFCYFGSVCLGFFHVRLVCASFLTVSVGCLVRYP